MTSKEGGDGKPPAWPITVIKVGGALVGDDASLVTLWRSVGALRDARRVIVVHGGGPRATEVARRLGHEPRVVHGRRVTGDLDLQIVQWTMRGELSGRLVASAALERVPAAGISGVDGGVLHVVKRPPWDVDGERVDFGWVGDVERVDSTLLRVLLEAGVVPVVAPLGIDSGGRIYNVNADTVSCALASAVGASEYLLVTESGGVRRKVDRAETLLSVFRRSAFDRGIDEGWIQGGMRVKLNVAFEALAAGIPEVFIVPPEGILNRSLGTQILD